MADKRIRFFGDRDAVGRVPPYLPEVLYRGGCFARPGQQRGLRDGRGGGRPQEASPVIWLHGQECTGPTEALLRSGAAEPGTPDPRPDLARLSPDAGCRRRTPGRGDQAPRDAGTQGQYLLVVEGCDPLAQERHLLQDRRPDDDRCDLRGGRASAAAIVAPHGSCARPRGNRPLPNPGRAVGASVPDRQDRGHDPRLSAPRPQHQVPVPLRHLRPAADR